MRDAITTTRCDMQCDCHEPITHIDRKGYLYCATHGLDRRRQSVSCRKLTATELERIESGQAITRY